MLGSRLVSRRNEELTVVIEDQQFTRDRDHRSVESVARTEPLARVPDVILDCTASHEELAAYLRIGVSGANQGQHLKLPSCELALAGDAQRTVAYMADRRRDSADRHPALLSDLAVIEALFS